MSNSCSMGELTRVDGRFDAMERGKVRREEGKGRESGEGGGRNVVVLFVLDALWFVVRQSPITIGHNKPQLNSAHQVDEEKISHKN